MAVNANQLSILRHSLGIAEDGRGEAYRNHFCTGEDDRTNFPDCLMLVELGLMTRTPGNAITGGDDLFRVTDKGRMEVLGHKPAPLHMTRSQRRYQAWLDADNGSTFGEYLKRTRSDS